MECMFEAYLTHEPGHLDPDDIPQTKDPVWILGRKYNAIQELEIIRRDILSKLWFTYRKGFIPIGGADGLTTDKGWGCMLRCGQMVLAQALVILHMGRDWYWTPECKDPTYLKILNRFKDHRQAPYSIHQIALMGASEGKAVGQWFGPNTIAQVLKKLVVYDEWSSITIQVALDNVVIINEIKRSCICQLSAHNTEWKPLLLIVPLRLGLNEINPIYIPGLQACFKFKQSIGVIGGKPNLALYFIGALGGEVLYLDPHTTQKTGSIDKKELDDQIELDNTYHCKRASRIPILSIDPSVALCFFCATEEDFDNLCDLIRDQVILPYKQPLFELSDERPQDWVPSNDEARVALEAIVYNEFVNVEDKCNSEDEFEIL